MRQLQSDSPNCLGLIGTHVPTIRRSPETRVSARVGLWPENPSDNTTFSSRMTVSYGQTMRWMRRRGDRVTITTGKYAGHFILALLLN